MADTDKIGERGGREGKWWVKRGEERKRRNMVGKEGREEEEEGKEYGG